MSNIDQPLYGEAAVQVRDQLATLPAPAVRAQLRAAADPRPTSHPADDTTTPAETAREHTTPAPCHLYPGLCTSVDGEDGDQVDENGRHFDHGGDAITVPSRSHPDDPEIWAEFTHVSAGVPHIGFMGESLTPDQAYEKADQLRQFADQLDDLAHQVHIARSLYGLRQARQTADPAFAEVLTIMEKAIVEDGANPDEVSDEVLRILRQTRAEQAGDAR
jgi:hypothetical protein